jgi:hypothetical protein
MPQPLLVALYVRDALGLVVADEVDLPPPLSMAFDQRADADAPNLAEQWVDWWRALLADEVRRHAIADAADPHGRRAPFVRALASPRRHFDPPAFTSLQATPLLRRRVRELWPAAAHANWREPGRIDGAFAGVVARDIAAERGVTAGALDGTLIVLPVRGSWAWRQAPGIVVCSAGMIRYPAHSVTVLRLLWTG